MACSSIDSVSGSSSFLSIRSASFKSISQDLDSPFPAESGRYYLFLSFACPWACMCLTHMKSRGLDKIPGHTGTCIVSFWVHSCYFYLISFELNYLRYTCIGWILPQFQRTWSRAWFYLWRQKYQRTVWACKYKLLWKILLYMWVTFIEVFVSANT